MPVWSRREVLAFLDRVEPELACLDHYDLLDVAADAGDEEIQDAFHGMAAALHPDRHRRELTAEQLERLTIVYARIAEAYRVLREPMLRQVYLRDMARAVAAQRRCAEPLAANSEPIASQRIVPSTLPPRSMANTAPPAGLAVSGAAPGVADELARINPKAQSLYRRAQAALRTGDKTSALLNLRMALAAHPTSTLIKEALARLEGRK
jgi:curved DNA-binding protein CbpA